MPILRPADRSLFRIHPNGGGYICHRSDVEEGVYLASMVVVRNSTIRGDTRIEGDVSITNSCVLNSKILESPDDEVAYGMLIDVHLSKSTLIGTFDIENCFMQVTQTQSAPQGMIELKNLRTLHSFFGGDVCLTGILTDGIEVPLAGCPSTSCTHLEGRISMDVPCGTRLHSTAIKPGASPLRAYPNRYVLEEMIASLPPEKS